MFTRRMRRTVPVLDEYPDRPVVIGVDPSLNGTGIAVILDGRLVDWKGWTTTKSLQQRNQDVLAFTKLPKGADDNYRLWRISTMSDWVVDVVDYIQRKYRRDAVVAIEGYAFSRQSLRVSDMHELGGLIKVKLWKEQIPSRIYSPTLVKKAMTGNGTADKGAMKIACYKRFKKDVTKYGDAGENLADAALIAYLLYAEISVRSGRIPLKSWDTNIRDALQRTSKAEPSAVISRPFITRENFVEPAVLGIDVD